MVGVIGISEDGYLARVYVDAKTGRVIIAEEKRETGWESVDNTKLRN